MRGRYREKYKGKEAVRRISDALESTHSKQNLRTFLEGFLTENERTMIAQRLMVAFALLEGWSYRMIRGEIGASLTTITRVHRWLERKDPHYRRGISLRYKPQKHARKMIERRSGILAFAGRNIFKSVTGTDL